MNNDLYFSDYLNSNISSATVEVYDTPRGTQLIPVVYEYYEGPYKYVTINGETRKYLNK